MEKKQEYPTQTVSIPAATPECVVALSPKTYQILKEHVERAEERGLSTRFSYWLETCLVKGIQSTQRPWDNNDLLRAVKQQLREKQAETVQVK